MQHIGFDIQENLPVTDDATEAARSTVVTDGASACAKTTAHAGEANANAEPDGEKKPATDESKL